MAGGRQSELPAQFLADYPQLLAEVSVTGRRARREELEAFRELGEKAGESGHGLRELVGLYVAEPRRAWSELPGVAKAAGPGERARTGDAVMGALEAAVVAFTHTHVGPNCRVYRELRLPMVTDGKGRFGRADVVLCPRLMPDLVIELDSRPNPASAQKLAFAHDTGAFPLWVRFGAGGIEHIAGVIVIDMREAMQGVCEAGT